MKSPVDQQKAHELDAMRCRVARRVWGLAFVMALVRLVNQQVRLLIGLERQLPGFDYAAGLAVSLGLLLQVKPQIVNPRSLDAWYVATALLCNLTLIFIPSFSVDPQDLLLVHLTTAPVLALLTRRTSCFLFSMAMGTGLILWSADVQWTVFLSGSRSVSVLVAFVLPVLGVFAVRWLLHEYVVVKMDLQNRMAAEMGAASSLLLVCHFAYGYHLNNSRVVSCQEP